MLTIKELSKVYGNGTRALNNVSLTIPTGMFGLLGPNGAGKSTLMRILATLQEPDSGTITMNGIDVLKDRMAVKKILGYLPQDFDFYKRDNARDLLLHFALLEGIASRSQRLETVEQLLQKVNLWDVRKQKLGTFSGGMKQRLGIALVLLGNPRLIIVDEPTAGLDPYERNHFHNILSEVGENVIVILSTHIVDDVADLCTSMAIINGGEIILRDSPARAIQSLSGRIWSRQVDKDQLKNYREKYEVISSRLYAGKTIIRIVSGHNPGDGFMAVDPTLEDVYFLNIKSARP